MLTCEKIAWAALVLSLPLTVTRAAPEYWLNKQLFDSKVFSTAPNNASRETERRSKFCGHMTSLA